MRYAERASVADLGLSSDKVYDGRWQGNVIALLPSEAAQAVEENQWACSSRAFGNGFHEEEDLAWCATGILDPGFNGVFKARLRPDALDR